MYFVFNMQLSVFYFKPKPKALYFGFLFVDWSKSTYESYWFQGNYLLIWVYTDPTGPVNVVL